MTEPSDESVATGPAAPMPLAGQCVLVTRAAHQAAALADPLRALGAEVLVAPVIETVDPEDWAPADQAISSLETYDWIVLTSANAVDRIIGRMEQLGVPPEALQQARIAAVGPATAARLEERGIAVEVVPDDRRAEGLVEVFRESGLGTGARVLLPRAAVARDVLPDALREAGVRVDVVAVYRTVPALPDPTLVERLRRGEVDVVTFTSPSTVRHFLAWLRATGLDSDVVMGSVEAASIGPVTTEALVGLGYRVPIEASDSTMPGLARAIAAARAGSSGVPG